MKQFLPISRADMKAQGIKQLDFVYVMRRCICGSPIFRARNYQPNITGKWFYGRYHFTAGLERSGQSIQYSGTSQDLDFLYPAGNMDSMVNHYSVSKKRRQKDAYHARRRHGKTPGLCQWWCIAI